MLAAPHRCACHRDGSSSGLLALVAVVWLILACGAIIRSTVVDQYWAEGGDFSLYAKAAEMLSQGQNPYDYRVRDGRYDDIPDFVVYHAYAYPPLFAELLGLPLRIFGIRIVRYSWLLIGVVSLAATLLLILRGFGNRASWIACLLALAFSLSMYPVRNDLYHGQVNFVLLLALMGALWMRSLGRATLAGVLLGLVWAVKPFLGVLVFYLLWRREWRTACTGIVVVGALTVVSFLVTYHGDWSVLHRMDCNVEIRFLAAIHAATG